tara:strand:+ start:252 stop:425 length:174 start_codon:yes stop_codon:yes gene_type:complete
MSEPNKMSIDDINKLPILMAIFREHKLSLVEAKKIADTVIRKINEQQKEYWERSECS